VGVPGWNNEFVITIPNEKYEMEGLVDDSVFYSRIDTLTGENLLWINFSDSSEKEYISGEDLSIEPITKHYKAKIGEMTLNASTPESTDDIDLSTFLGTALSPGDVLPPDADQHVVDITNQDISFSLFSSARIKNAEILVTLKNNLFLNFDEVKIDLYNKRGTSRVFLATLTFPGPILNHSTITNTDNPIILENVNITNEFSLDYRVTTSPRDEAHTITEDDINGTIGMDMQIKTITVTSVTAKLPEQSFVNKDSASADGEDINISFAEIDKGAVHIYLTNYLPVSGKATVKFHDLYKDGEPLETDMTFQKGSNVPQEISVDLAGVQILNSSDPGNLISYFHYTTFVTTDSSDGEISITSLDSVSSDIVIDSLYFSTVSGNFNRKEVSIESVAQEDIIDYGELSSGFIFNNVKLILDLYNEIGIPVNADFTITGKHKNGDGVYTDSVTINMNNVVIAGGQNGNAALTRIILDKNSSSPNIVDLMEILPTDIFFSGTAFVEGMGTISLGNGFWSKFNLNMPVSFRIPDPISVEGEQTDITDETIDPDMAEKIRNDVTGALFHGEIGNHLPVGISVQLHVAKNADSLYSDTISDSSNKFIIDNICLPAAPIDLNGMTTSEVSRVIDFELSKKNIELLGSPPYFIGYKFIIDSTETEVFFKTSDYISSQGYFRISININSN
jgi:hypothetical protein